MRNDNIGFGAFPVQDRAKEIGALIVHAEKCNVPLDSDLFWKLIDRVYPDPIGTAIPPITAMFDTIMSKFDMAKQQRENELIGV